MSSGLKGDAASGFRAQSVHSNAPCMKGRFIDLGACYGL